MKFKVLLFITPLITLSAATFATPLVDSIGIENLDGKKVILHKLDPKDNYYAVGRRYNVRPNLIIQLNNNAPLKVGEVIKVPTDRPFLEATKQISPPVQQPVATVQPPVQKPAVITPPVTTAQPAANTPIAAADVTQYKVSAGETLFSIAKRFNSTVDDITKLNNLTTTTLSAGQLIKVKTNSADAVVPVARPTAKRDSVTYASPQDSINAVKFGTNRFGLYEKSEKGIATWIDDAGLDPSKKLALHRTAPIGTVIKITNPMTSRTTFAKVVGRITDNEATKDAILVVTKNVAESIGGLDKRIHVNISYGSPNE